MAKITDKADLNVGVELVIDEAARTYELVATGNLVAKDGCTFRALYSKFVDLWATATYQDSPFPFNALDALSGQYLVGIDAGGNANGWKPLDDTTRQMKRDGGWEEYNTNGELNRVYAGIGGLGTVSTGAQLYYQRDATDAPTDFTFDDQANEGIQVFGTTGNTPSDAGAGNFDKRTFFKGYLREQGKKFADSVLADTGKTSTGANIVNLLLSNEDDLKISDLDVEMTNAPYNNIVVDYFLTNQARTISGVTRNFKIIIDGNNATLEQIYTKIQYLLRQNSDINNAGNAGTKNGQTADILLGFVGDELQTTVSVYIDNIQNADTNRVVFKDAGGINRINPFTSAGELTFNPVMVGAGSSYRLMYTTGPSALDDYGEAGAITVLDNSGSPITGTISAGSISFDFDYDNDANGGTAGTDKPVTLIGIRPNSSKFAVGTGVLSASKAITVSLVAETDRAYV